MIEDSEDTICAISTPAGVGGIAVARVSGKKAIEIADGIWKGARLCNAVSHSAHLGDIIDDSGEVLDTALATVFRAPRSFTGEDVVEISVHGSTWIQRELINLLIRHGCRMARPGEFTRRAFSAGQMDLAEAEAVADVIASSSRAAHRIAVSQMKGHFSNHLSSLRDRLIDLASLLELELDFSEEDVEFASREKLLAIADEVHKTVSDLTASFATGQALKDGVPVALVGRPNVGKSTLLNILLGDERAIVSAIPGTTRDTIEDTAEIDGVKFRFIDTAGLRDTSDEIEQLGIDRAVAQIKKAKIVVLVIDPTATDDIAPILENIGSNIQEDSTLLIALNKSDISNANVVLPRDYLRISALTGYGIPELRHALVNASGAINWESDRIVTNARHYESLTQARQSISRVINGLQLGISGDFIAQDVRETIHHIGEITGAITTDTILTTIFSRFCIGK